jgi:hypothetical protein
MTMPRRWLFVTGFVFAVVASGCSDKASVPASAGTVAPSMATQPASPPAPAASPPVGTPPRAPARNPGDGPWNRDVLSYRSPDGQTFGKPATAFERAGVPCLIRDRSGRLIAVFQWFPFDQRAAFDRVAVAFSSDDGRTWTTPAPVNIAGMPSDLQRPFDPTIVELPDGRLRLYFTSGAAAAGGPPGQGNVGIYSAISNDAIPVPDGVNFRFESSARFAPAGGTVDASIVLFQGTWHLFSHNQKANTGLGYHAVSQDGLAFTQQADVNAGQGRQWIGNAVVDGSGLRYYGSGMRGVWSAISRDGATWTVDPGIRVDGGDASVAILGNGERLLLAVGPPREDAGPAPF